MWNPSVKVGEKRKMDRRGHVYFGFLDDVDVSNKKKGRVELTSFNYGSFEFTLKSSNAAATAVAAAAGATTNDPYVYFLVVECDGCERDLL